MLRITIVAGARPNFMKIAPIIHAIKNFQEFNKLIDYRLVHTGQHYDRNMSGSFFEQLDIPDPHSNLACEGRSQSEQTASILVSFEKELLRNPCDLVLVVGDVNSTMACSIVAKKLKIKVAHVEGGIRSGDLDMPEEINRILTDSISDYFFTTSENANQNLLNNGVNKDKIFFVGNTMIDTLLKHKSQFFPPTIWRDLNLRSKGYFVMTLHRPSNVDEEESLKQMINGIIINSRQLPIIFPVHPRTARVLNQLKLNFSNIYMIEPISYLEFNYLVNNAKAVITDSGGITEEASILRVPCMTLRDNTERQETIDLGTNELIGTNTKQFMKYFDKLFNGQWKTGGEIPMWDGNSAKRIVNQIWKLYQTKSFGTSINA